MGTELARAAVAAAIRRDLWTTPADTDVDELGIDVFALAPRAVHRLAMLHLKQLMVFATVIWDVLMPVRLKTSQAHTNV